MSNYMQVLENSGYTVFVYSGHLRNAPPRFKHVFRDLPAGHYLLHETEGPLPETRFDTHTTEADFWVAAATYWGVSRGLVFLKNAADGLEISYPADALTPLTYAARNNLRAQLKAPGWFAYDTAVGTLVYTEPCDSYDQLIRYLVKGSSLELPETILTVPDLLARLQRLQEDLAEVAAAIEFLV